jgi:hypothetical protein
MCFVVCLEIGKWRTGLLGKKWLNMKMGALYRNRLKCANIRVSFVIHLCRYDEFKHERFNDIKDLQTWCVGNGDGAAMLITRN